jgi:putative glutamine amidotransferase
MTTIPRIGIIKCSFYTKYKTAILIAGGEPIQLPTATSIEEISQQVADNDAILLPGGRDLEIYDDDNPDHLISPDVRTHYSGLLREALKAKKPLLGICLGFQAIAYFQGGQLIKDIHREYPDIHNHTDWEDSSLDLPHTVLFPENSPLRRIIGDDRLKVGCHHHQAIKTLPAGYVLAAVSEGDGIIEAICLPNLDEHFVLGLQWHAERSFEKDERNALIFKAFVEQARKTR